MSFKPSKSSHGSPDEATSSPVNLTPLIDVSLVLVVILLLATPLAFESSIAVQRSKRTGRQAQNTDPAPKIELHLVDEYQVMVNRESVALAQLESFLRPMLEEAPTTPVVVRCDDEVSHGTFVTVLDEAKAAGAGSIAVMGGAR